MTTPGAYPYPPLVPESQQEVAARLAAALGRAWDDVDARYQRVLQSANDLRRDEALATLAELRLAVESFQARVAVEGAQYATYDIPVQYALGAQTADRFGPFAWTQPHMEAAQALAADGYGDLLRRSEEAGRTERRFARAVREAFQDDTVLAAVGRMTAQQVGRRLAERLEQEGLRVATYSDGSHRDMRTYTEMAVRTKTGVAHNAGALNRYAEVGIRYVEVFDGGACGWTSHQDARKLAGKVLPVEEAFARPLSHPNCTRAFGARPDVTSPEQAAGAEPSTTAEQRADQLANEQMREQAVRRRETRSAQARRATLQQRRAARRRPAAAAAPVRELTGDEALTTAWATVREPLTEAQYKAVRSYAGGGYSRTNQYLRGEVTLEGDRLAQLEERIGHLDTLALRHPLPAPVLMWRGYGPDFADLIGSNAVGTEFIDRAFASASTYEKVAEGFANRGVLTRIHVPAGHPVLPIDPMYSPGTDVPTLLKSPDNEGELTLVRGTRYRIVGDTMDSTGRRVLDMEVIGYER